MTYKNNKISFIYFDVGGVVIKDFSKTDNWNLMLVEWKIPEDRLSELNKRFDEFEKEVCVGRDVEEFLPILKSEFGVKLPENYSLLENFVKRFSKNEGLKKLLKNLEKKYNLGLLTNMYPGLLAAIQERKLLPEVGWKVVIDSTVVKCRKPDEKIYELAQKEAAAEGEKILFVDNKMENFEVPKRWGWQTFYYDSADYERSSAELEKFLG
jgi:FMN phosphatase YigB (HAD superfamily)